MNQINALLFRLGVMAMVLMVGFFLILTPLTEQLAQRTLYMPSELKHADVIVVFSAGILPHCHPDRFTLARENYGLTLLQQGLSRSGKIIFSGGWSPHTHINIGQCMTRYAEHMGIDKNRLVTEPQAETTYENAFYTNRIMQQNHWHSVLLVTSATHIKRSVKTMKAYLVKVYPAPTPPDESTHWLDSDRLTLFYLMLYEYAGLIKYQFYHLYDPLPATPSPQPLAQPFP